VTWPDPARFAAINSALDSALGLEGAARLDFVARWCQARPDLAAPLQALLLAAEEDETRLTTPLTGALIEAMSIAAGARLGDWQLLKRLGQGGMAEVWLARGEGAHQDQHAAVKRPLLASSTDQNAPERFAAERRRLAALADARIARLIDSGVDTQGQPWFAMEYVDGERIDQYCDTHALPLVERVRWLREVALAVHSAHQALVVHRDLKPANVLITRINPQVKLLDFGIAKDLNAEEAPTLDPALTPQYASPEQWLGGPITIASDIYQLGLLLFELASGCRPGVGPCYDAERGPPSMAQALAAAAEPAIISARRATTPQALMTALRGDLAAIVAYATAREPGRRYPSAAALADDLVAWIEGLPVRARTPSVGYRLGRFFRRHALASSLVALLIVVAATALTLYVQQAHRLADEARASVQVQAYLINLLRQADPLFSGKPDLAPGPLLEASLVLARRELAEQPALLAVVLQVGADAHIRRADFTTGTQLLTEALALPLAPGNSKRVQLLARMGQSLHYQARYAEAEHYLRAALPHWQRLGVAGNLSVPLALVDVLHSRGDYNAALQILDDFEPAADKKFARFVWQRDRGTLLRDAGRHGESLEHLQAALVTSGSFAGDLASRSTVLLALARLYALTGDTAACLQAASAGAEIARSIYGEHQAVPGMFRHNQALAAELSGRHAEAEALLTTVLARDYAMVAPGNVLIAYAQLDRAWNRARTGGDVESDLRAAARTLAAVTPSGHPRLSEVHLLRALLATDRQLAESELAQALAVRSNGLGSDHLLTREAAAWRSQVRAGAPAGGKTLLAQRITGLARAR